MNKPYHIETKEPKTKYTYVKVVAVFAFQDTQTIILVTASLINTVILFFSIKSAIKTQVKFDMSLFGKVILRFTAHIIHGLQREGGGVGRLYHTLRNQITNYTYMYDLEEKYRSFEVGYQIIYILSQFSLLQGNVQEVFLMLLFVFLMLLLFV